MKLDKKKIIAISSVVALTGVAIYMATKRRSIRFYDNVFCEGDTNCPNVDPQSYVQMMIDADAGTNFVQFQGGDGVGAGYMNLFFPQGHGLKEGDIITVKQDAGAAFPSYNGDTTVKKVLSPYIIRTAKAFKGSSPSVQGTVYTQTWIEKTF